LGRVEEGALVDAEKEQSWSEALRFILPFIIAFVLFVLLSRFTNAMIPIDCNLLNFPM
jgi:hypothetical protein